MNRFSAIHSALEHIGAINFGIGKFTLFSCYAAVTDLYPTVAEISFEQGCSWFYTNESCDLAFVRAALAVGENCQSVHAPKGGGGGDHQSSRTA